MHPSFVYALVLKFTQNSGSFHSKLVLDMRIYCNLVSAGKFKAGIKSLVSKELASLKYFKPLESLKSRLINMSITL